MARYFLDTNLVLRIVDFNDALHAQASAATLKLLRDGHDLTLNSQVLIELWGVATRPAVGNGLGWNPVDVAKVIDHLRSRFTFLEDTLGVFENWLQLVTFHNVRGKQVHDTRLVAAMLAHGIIDLLTFNQGDFKRFSSIRAVNPTELTAST